MVHQEKAQDNGLRIEFDPINSSIYWAKVTVPHPIVATLYEQTARILQQTTSLAGFNKGNAPIAYIKNNYKATIVDHVKSFLFTYYVLSFLQRSFLEHKMVVAGEPRLSSASITPESDAVFVFEITLFPDIELLEWKFFPFKAPKRKQYRDLDKQVEAFISEEQERTAAYTTPTLQPGDWVGFTITIVDENGESVLFDHQERLWFHLGEEEADGSLRELFLGKQIGDTLYSTSKELQDYFSGSLHADFIFRITIHSIVPHAYVCLENFKKHFKLKSSKEMYKKMIEVFSYRKDLSQRRSMVEESLKLLLNKHKFSVPNHLVLRQQNGVIEGLRKNPDYHVYRVQPDFQEHIRQLSEKRAKEQIIIDCIAYKDALDVATPDIETYLNLTKRSRLKEFIYFDMPHAALYGQDLPISEEMLKQSCLREKTLNHVIYHLTKE